VDVRGRTGREGALVVRQAVWSVTGAAGRPLRACRPGGIGPNTTHRAAERGQAVECFGWNELLGHDVDRARDCTCLALGDVLGLELVDALEGGDRHLDLIERGLARRQSLQPEPGR